MNICIRLTTSLFLFLIFASCTSSNELQFEVTYDSSLASSAFDGRLLVLISSSDRSEPRFQINDNDDTGIIIGKDVSNWASETPELVGGNQAIYPLENLKELKAGRYYIQALLHKYDTFELANGHSVQLPMDQGEGQHWNTSPKNIYSTPQ